MTQTNDRRPTENLYRRWRPGRLETMAGQEATRTIVSNAGRHQRLSHAYLLSGPRGTGKTSMARIIAKMANCPGSPELGDACDQCDACRRTAAGQHPDVVEMDAATHRSLDDVKRLQDHVRYLPATGRRRVVIIDEVHALDHRAVPALLKILEEPPSHAMFILCTTEDERMPATIVSRCQRHAFARLSPADVANHLTKVAAAEQISASPEEIRAIARACHGGMRDAINLLEQLNFSAPNDSERLTSIGVYADDRRALPIIKPLLQQNQGAAIAALNDAVWEGADLNLVKRSGTEILRHAVFAVTGQADANQVHEETRQEIAEALRHPAATSARVTLATKLWSQAELGNDAPSTLALELAIMEACLGQPVTPPAGVPAQAAPYSDVRTPTGGISRPEQTTTRPNAEAPAQATADLAEMTRRWRKTMASLSRLRAGGFWIAPLLRDIRTGAISQNWNGDLTLPFTNQANLTRFQSVLDGPDGNNIRMQLAEATNTGRHTLVATLAHPGSPESHDAETQQAERPNIRETSPLAKAAMSLNGRLLRE